MVKKMVVSLVAIFLMTVFLNLALAQEEKSLSDEELRQEKKYDELYDRERFDAADTNSDGFLDKEELEAAQTKFEYRDEKRFQHADTDNDNLISLDEAKVERRGQKTRYERMHPEIKEDLKDKKDK